MPSVGEQGWGDLVSNNFEILDTNLNDLQTQIDTIDTQIDTINTNIGNGTRILSISSPSITITTSNFGNYTYYENNVYVARFYGNITFSSIPQPSRSCRLMIIVVNGDATISGNIDTYPTTLRSETPPNSTSTNTYGKEITFSNFSSCTLTYTANGNNSQLIMDTNDYITFLGKRYMLLIPHAIAAGGDHNNINGTTGTANNTCNGGGGGTGYDKYTGGTGCIFGQYAGGIRGNTNGYGYGSSASNKYRCGLVIIAFGNLTINSTITQNGGNGRGYYGSGDSGYGGYGGGAYYAGGGGAPVFIYYIGTYTNTGTINTAGGSGISMTGGAGYGGAGGIKVTKISI